MDRSGRTYKRRIAPDELAALDWTAFGTDDDPALRGAIDWLQAQPACAGGGSR